MNYTIRYAREEDVPAIEDLIEPFVDQGILLERTYDEIRGLLPGFFVAETETGELIGCVALEIYNRKLAEVRSLAVAPRAQGLGVGHRLVEACLQRAREHRVLEVMAVTAKEHFFQSCGFDFTLPGLKRALFYQTGDLPLGDAPLPAHDSAPPAADDQR